VVTICTTSSTFSNSTFSPHSVFMCSVWISEQTAIISQHNINWLVFITETESVYCAVRTEHLYIIQIDLRQCRTSYEVYTALWHFCMFRKRQTQNIRWATNTAAWLRESFVLPACSKHLPSVRYARECRTKASCCSQILLKFQTWSFWAVRFAWRQTDCHTDWL